MKSTNEEVVASVDVVSATVVLLDEGDEIDDEEIVDVVETMDEEDVIATDDVATVD